MKKLSRMHSKILFYLSMVILMGGFAGCSDDDDVGDVTPQPTATLTVQDQSISQNRVIIQTVTVGQDSWIVIRNSGEETSANIVSEPVFIEAGTHTNVVVPLTNTANLAGNAAGDELVVMIHADTGTRGTYDYNAQSGTDSPIRNSGGTDIAETITVTGSSLTAADDQVVTANNEVTFSSVNMVNAGWIALYGQNEDGTINEDDLIGVQYVEAGEHENFLVPFNEGYVFVPGSTVYPRIYMDDPDDQEFTYVAGGEEDLPETYGFDDAGQGRFIGNTSTTGGFTLQ